MKLGTVWLGLLLGWGLFVGAATINPAYGGYTLDDGDVRNCENALFHLERRKVTTICGNGNNLSVQMTFNALIAHIEQTSGQMVEVFDQHVASSGASWMICAQIRKRSLVTD